MHISLKQVIKLLSWCRKTRIKLISSVIQLEYAGHTVNKSSFYPVGKIDDMITLINKVFYHIIFYCTLH